MTARTDLASAVDLSVALDKVTAALDILNGGGLIVGVAVALPNGTRSMNLPLPGFTNANVITRLTSYQTSLQTQLAALGVT